MKAISMDLRKRIVEAYDAGEGTRQEIADRFKVSVHMVKKLLAQRRKLGSLETLRHRCGRKAKFNESDLEWLKETIGKRPDITLFELCKAFKKPCSTTTIFRTLRKIKASYKKTLKAAEQNRADVVIAREVWHISAGSTDTARLVFIDESGAKTNMTRLYGRGFDGGRVYDCVPHGHWSATTMIAAVGTEGTRAPFVFEGAMDAEMFVAYVKHVLVPELRPGDIVVMDNLRSHKNAHAHELIEQAGGHVWFLPPYSPDFNPIEKMWSKIKAFLRKACARTQETLYQAIADALATVTQSDIRGWFESCGYII